jgi:hypothetical protein
VRNWDDAKKFLSEDATCFAFVAGSSARPVTLVCYFGVSVGPLHQLVTFSRTKKKVEVSHTQGGSAVATKVCRQSDLRSDSSGAEVGQSERLKLLKANSNMPCHAMPMPRYAVTLRSRFKNCMVVAWHERGMACVNQTWPHRVN